MATFFQPGFNEAGGVTNCTVGGFKIFCNSILPASRRLAKWWQGFDMILAATTIVIPLLLYTIYRLHPRRKKENPSIVVPSDTKPAESPTSSSSSSKTKVGKWGRMGGTDSSKRSVSVDDSTRRGSPMGSMMGSLRNTKSFRVVSEFGWEEMETVTDHDLDNTGTDLFIFPMQNPRASTDLDSIKWSPRSSIASGMPENSRPPSISSDHSGPSMGPSQMKLGSVDLELLGDEALTDDAIKLTVAGLVERYVQLDLMGFAIRSSATTKAEQLDSLIGLLQHRGISCILMINHDSKAISSINLKDAAGIIVENACILPDGKARDYFQSRNLRELMIRCAREREHRPDFFIGYLDQWLKRPHPAVVKRAIKLAEHYGAVLEHGPFQIAPGVASSGNRTIGGFEYLRRPEIVDLQRSWTSETRKVNLGQPTGHVAHLPLDDIEQVLPGIAECLEMHDLPEELVRLQYEVPPLVNPPSYVEAFPSNMYTNFWESDQDGRPLAPMGCFPVGSEPTMDLYISIAEEQAHLRELTMLHSVEGPEEQNILKSLRSLAGDPSADVVVHDLIHGLSTRTVRVYKGLHTGFRAPDSPASFWGVSRIRDPANPGTIDIFISQNSPNDASVIIHTWLAHHGRSKIERIKHELVLENLTGQGHPSGLPTTVRAALEQSSTAELLLLLQSIRLSGPHVPLGETIKTYIRGLLIDDTTKSTWTSLCARKALDGTMSMVEMLCIRLEHHARNGATQLPLLEDLVRMYNIVDEAMVDALFHGWHDVLSTLAKSLLDCYTRWPAPPGSDHQVDVQADMFALVFFTCLRRAAFEDVYIETTDRCPIFLCQPDQAAVFSELWTLGSQCENYFGVVPRDIGNIIYERRTQALEALGSPTAKDRKGNEIMTMYASTDDEPPTNKEVILKMLAESATEAKLTPYEWFQVWKMRFAAASAMSIFCAPAIVDVVLLTFVGRGLFMTAYMRPEFVQVAGYALLVSLLLTAGVTGWVGSAGSHYLPHYAYDNVILFHVQRLSGGFILALVISILGVIGFGLRMSVAAGFVFAAYLMSVSTYLNLLGIMSTMHQHGSPLPSGRNVFLQTFPLLFLSPLLSSLVNGHDLEIYLPIMYGFLFITLYRYRRLCHQWSTWMDNIPTFKHSDIIEWYTSRMLATDEKKDESDLATDAREDFKAAVESWKRRDSAETLKDPLVAKAAKGLPYVDWLFKKAGGETPDLFTTAWFTALGEALSQQRSLARGLKDHNVLTLFRIARFDLAQNLGLFLVALLDRWVMLVMSARQPYPSIYRDGRSRYAFCFCIVYFCLSSMVLDATLFKYWSIRDALSEEKLVDLAHAQRVARQADAARKECLLKALTDVMSKVLFLFGALTMLLWLFVDDGDTTILYYMYMFGYTCCILFQFNRCFTTNVSTHVKIILYSAAVGFVAGCILHALPWTCGFLYNDVIVQNCAAASAAIGTSLWTIKDWGSVPSPLLSPAKQKVDDPVYVQPRLMTPRTAEGPRYKSDLPKAFLNAAFWTSDGTATSSHVSKILCLALSQTNISARWATRVLQSTLEMWTTGRLTVAVLGREHFVQAGVSDFASLSCRNGLGLHVAICFSQPVTQFTQLLPNVIAEALVYHVAHVHLALSPEQALHAEHMIKGLLSTRLANDLAVIDQKDMTLLPSMARHELMRHLCLDLDVDTQWESLPQDAREVIVSRIEGTPSKFSSEFNAWASQVDIDTSDFGVDLSLILYQRAVDQLGCTAAPTASYQPPPALKPAQITIGKNKSLWHRINSIPFRAVKWIAIITGGGSNIERELHYLLGGSGIFLRLVLLVWKICWVIKNQFVYWILLYHRPAIARIARLAKKGARRKVFKNQVVVELTRKAITGFASVDEDGTMTLQAWNGTLDAAPTKEEPLFVATYDRENRLRVRENTGAGRSTYQYDSEKKSRRPISVTVVNDKFRSVGFYDKRGRVVKGKLSIEDVELEFTYHYKRGNKGNSHVLRADYRAGMDTLSVFWGIPVDIDDYTWVPSKNVGLIIRVIGGKTYTTEYDYSHRRDPVRTTYLEEGNGRRTVLTEAPAVCANEEALLDIPTNHSFNNDDLLISHSALQLSQMRAYAATNKKSYNPARWVSVWKRRQYQRIPTWLVRTELWNQWLSKNDLDAVTACTVDEIVLREEPLLKEYWRARDRGHLDAARRVLDDNISQIVSAIDIDTDVSEKTLLAIRTSDLYAMGLAQDANAVTTRPQDCYNDTRDRISVIFNDIGCWPVAPGGVSNCRRDLVNGHSTIRNHVLAECANDYGIPRFQVEKSVQSLKLLPLWGLDGGTARHGVIDNYLESQVDAKVDDTDLDRDIVGTFVPLLDAFVKGCRMRRLGYNDLLHLSNVFLSMGKYYEHKDYTKTWRSPEVEQAWVAAWLKSYDDPNVVDPTEFADISRPSMFDFRQALYIYLAYFFIFAVGVPERCPQVFQSTHHGISSLFGMVLKYRRGVTFGIWDHAILWRESCLNFSVAQCQLPVAVQNMLLSGIGVATRLAYFHADVVLPCASLFNPMWETELGSDGSRVCSRSMFRRKIDPIVNGISNMDGFTPVDKVRTETPTVVMLSNVQFIKGVKFAIQAADIIINRFGFKDYRLVVYGAKDRQPSYCLEMEKLIVENNLSQHVVLAGFGNPKEVLKDAWLFMNSSISEGLPLAIGEAALAGVPIVATEVGATALVLTDPNDPEQRYGEVVPPNDPMALARAQISMLSMVGPWSKFTADEDPPALPDVITAEHAQWLTKRFYEYAEDRRKLGFLSRQVVLHSFHGSRYLREHEQMYWIQWHLSRMRRDPKLKPPPFKFGQPELLGYADPDDDDDDEGENHTRATK